MEIPFEKKEFKSPNVDLENPNVMFFAFNITSKYNFQYCLQTKKCHHCD